MCDVGHLILWGEKMWLSYLVFVWGTEMRRAWVERWAIGSSASRFVTACLSIFVSGCFCGRLLRMVCGGDLDGM